MSGETDLANLLSNMSPILLEPEYIFYTSKTADIALYMHLDPLAYFVEREGVSLIIDKDSADQAGFEYEAVLKCITLQIHSSLEAVGLTAAVATKLAEYDISANVVAAYYHDHVFVPVSKAENAMRLLSQLS
ncbi:ACT domain-containing protein [Neptunicella sp. SCSIO 80796]|uniref:ACT domain-containing protein n=1 Tax=Neptunicella plasticusilytica TaxID=3117012 RepID=UPI003A4D9E1A